MVWKMPRPSIVSLAFDLSDDDDRRDYIQIMMRRLGITIQDIADDQGVVRTLVSTVIAGQKRSSRMRAVIAEVIGMEPETLWPAPGNGASAM